MLRVLYDLSDYYFLSSEISANFVTSKKSLVCYQFQANVKIIVCIYTVEK